MADDTLTTAGIGRHGANRLPSVDVDSFNIELKDDDGFLGDRASKGAFQRILDGLRKPLQKNGDDPLGKKATQEIGKSTLDEALLGEDIAAAALVHGAIGTAEGRRQSAEPSISRCLPDFSLTLRVARL